MIYREGWKIIIFDIDFFKSIILFNWWYFFKGVFNVYEFVLVEFYVRSGGLSNYCDFSFWRGNIEFLY